MAWHGWPTARPKACAERRVMRARIKSLARLQLHHRPRTFAEMQAGHHGGQDVQRRKAVGAVARQDDILRRDAHAQRGAGGAVDLRDEQTPRAGDKFGQPIGVLRMNHAMQQGPGIAQAQFRGCRRVGQNLRHGACPHRFASRHNDQMIGQPRHLGRRMADIQDRQRGLIAQAFQIGQDLGLAGGVEGGERFIHQQKLWFGKQGAAKGDALLFAAGRVAGRRGSRGAMSSSGTICARLGAGLACGARTTGHSAGFAQRSDAGTAARPETHSRSGGGVAEWRCGGWCRSAWCRQG